MSESLVKYALKYEKLGWFVLPVHPVKKQPLIKWAHRKDRRPAAKEIQAWYKKWPTARIGVATGSLSGVDVVDLDGPRARERFDALCGTPETITQSTGRVEGGVHIFFKHNGHSLRNVAGQDENKGIDLRTDGGFVVVAPSSHKSGKRYKWSNINPAEDGLDDLLEMPADVIEHFKKQNGGNLERKPITLEPVDNGARNDTLARIVGKWVGQEMDRETVLLAANGWNSKLDEPLCGQEVQKTVESIFRTHERKHSEEQEAQEGKHYSEIQQSVNRTVLWLNEQYAVVNASGTTAVLREFTNPITGYKDIELSSVSSFNQYLANRKILVCDEETHWKPKKKKLSKEWLESSLRRQYPGLIFAPPEIYDPSVNYGASQNRNSDPPYNMFAGYAIEPKKGDWSLMKQHLREVISNGSQPVYCHIIALMADMFQRPGGKRPGVAIVLKGSQGVGKGIFVSNVGKIIGPHYIHIFAGAHFTGRFNFHLKDKLLVYVDEAIWGGDKTAEGRIKGYITEETLAIEPKGVDVVHLQNHMRFIIASNNDWIVPAGPDERRMFVIAVSPKRKGNHDYFKALAHQMDNGGREAMLYDLLEYDYSGVNLREFPRTEALLDQILHSASTVEKFWFEVLTEGNLETTVPKNEFYDRYLNFADRIKDRHPLADAAFGKKLFDLCPELKHGRPWVNGVRRTVYYFPGIEECRRMFQEKVGMSVDWNDRDKDQSVSIP
jgi:hypothetical protein